MQITRDSCEVYSAPSSTTASECFLANSFTIAYFKKKFCPHPHKYNVQEMFCEMNLWANQFLEMIFYFKRWIQTQILDFGCLLLKILSKPPRSKTWRSSVCNALKYPSRHFPSPRPEWVLQCWKIQEWTLKYCRLNERIQKPSDVGASG